jgi:hypothetical protein
VVGKKALRRLFGNKRRSNTDWRKLHNEELHDLYPPYNLFFFSMARQPLGGLGRLIIRGFTITHLDTPQSVGLLWTSDRPDRRRDYLTTHNTHKRQTSMPPLGFELTILVSERPQTHALDRAATGIGPQKH